MTAHDAAIVYDLDGTLVGLDVDWAAAETDVRDVYAAAGVAADPAADLWGLLEDAPEHGIADAVEAVLSERERAGARSGTRLPLAREVSEVEGPVGVCSLNAESAVRIALERFDLAPHVDAVVGRDTVAEQKPHPRPLLATLERLDAAPETATFVGDSASDGETAHRAGVAFEWVEERLDGRA